MSLGATPRVVLVSQWPSIKNAEYELIERIRRTGFEIAVTDFLGFRVDTRECLAGARLRDDYDFAIAFHYLTPKFLDIPTFLWVANPLEFMHMQGNYGTHIINDLRAYDDYLYNGSETLKSHIRRVVGQEWRDGGLAFDFACSRRAMIAPRAGATRAANDKLFYCGVNWEAITDRTGRAQGLLAALDRRQVAHFFGPARTENVDTWHGFSAYRGEIPFDGESIFPAMHGYEAVLALSSPAHQKSKTSSGRVIEGFASGVPVISDRNAHVHRQFGDLPYYFDGATDEERAAGILAALDRIRARPEEARERVEAAQQLIAREYCFESRLESIAAAIGQRRAAPSAAHPAHGDAKPAATRWIDIFLIDHDPYATAGSRLDLAECAAAARRAVSALRAASPDAGSVRLTYVGPSAWIGQVDPAGGVAEPVNRLAVAEEGWDAVRLGEKLALAARASDAEFALFLTPAEILHHDHLVKAMDWFARRDDPRAAATFVAGFFSSALEAPAPASADGILRNNASNGLHRWSQDSIAKHQLGQFIFNRNALAALDLALLSTFDLLLPVAVVLESQRRRVSLWRSRHLTLRVSHGYYHRYQIAHDAAVQRGFWAQQYELPSNAMHEINGLYDAFNETPEAVQVADRIFGRDRPAVLPLDPSLQRLAKLADRLRPAYRALRKVRRVFAAK